MTTPDIRTCPECGTPDCPVVSIERIEGLAGIAIAGDATTGFTARWDGTTEMRWDRSATLRYLCTACGFTLPEQYAAALDRLLANTREREE